MLASPSRVGKNNESYAYSFRQYSGFHILGPRETKTPSPLAGEGWGEGVYALGVAREACPSPS